MYLQRSRSFLGSVLGTALVLMISVQSALGQEARALTGASDTSGNAQIFVHDLTSSITMAGAYFTLPLRWSSGDWLMTGGTAAGTVISIEALDQPVRDIARRNHSVFGDKLASFGNFWGGGIPSVGIGGGLYLGGLFAHNDGVRLAGLHVAKSFAYAGLAVTALKFVIGRERPYNNDGPKVFHGPSMKNEWYSLPSGHVTVATALLSSLACDIKSPVASIGLGAIAATTVAARIYTDNHWFGDTFLAAALGTATGVWVSTQEVRGGGSAEQSGLTVAPTPNGIAAVVRF